MIFLLRLISILSLLWLTACGPSYHVICYTNTGDVEFEGDAMLYSPTDVVTEDTGTRDAKYKTCKYEGI